MGFSLTMSIERPEGQNLGFGLVKLTKNFTRLVSQLHERAMVYLNFLSNFYQIFSTWIHWVEN